MHVQIRVWCVSTLQSVLLTISLIVEISEAGTTMNCGIVLVENPKISKVKKNHLLQCNKPTV